MNTQLLHLSNPRQPRVLSLFKIQNHYQTGQLYSQQIS